MNKLSLPIALVALIICVISFFYHQPSSDLVYVDVNKLMDGYERTPIERAKLDEKIKGLESNVDSLIVDWQKEIKVYEKERSSMTEREIALKQELLENRQQQINNYREAVGKQIQEEDQKASQTVINDINDYIEEFGKENDYAIIFGASGGGNILYADDASDLTQEVLEGLNKEFSGIDK